VIDCITNLIVIDDNFCD